MATIVNKATGVERGCRDSDVSFYLARGYRLPDGVEAADVEDDELDGELPEWPLATDPEAYLRKYPDGPKAALAREVLGE